MRSMSRLASACLLFLLACSPTEPDQAMLWTENGGPAGMTVTFEGQARRLEVGQRTLFWADPGCHWVAGNYVLLIGGAAATVNLEKQVCLETTRSNVLVIFEVDAN